MGNVIVNKISGGLGKVTASSDGKAGMVFLGSTTVGGAQLDTVYKLLSVADAEALLLTSARDLAEKELIWNDISDFFRANPNGELNIIIKDKAATTPYASGITAGIPTLLNATNGDIKIVGVRFNGTTTTEALTTAAIAAAQAQATAAATANRPISIVIDGRAMPVGTNVRALNAPDVSVVLGQNLTVANLDALFNNATVVGLVLGVLSKIPVNQNIGWVEANNMFGGTLSVAGLSGTSIANQATNLATAEASGYIVLKTYAGKAGLYFNDDPTCANSTSDYSEIGLNRTINKAIRNVRLALLPSVNSPIAVDPSTGQLQPQVCKSFEMTARRSLDEMTNNEEVSGVTVEVNPEQNILSTSQLVVGLAIVPTGTARTIKVNIGFSNPF